MSSASGTWQKGAKLVMFLKKKDGFTDEQFSEYYKNKHAALANPVLLKTKCISYSQFHCLREKAVDEARSIFGPDSLKEGHPLQILPFDGCSTFVFASLDDARGFFHDAQTAEVLGPDAANFSDPALVHIAIGEEYVCVQDGKLVAN